MNMRSHCPVNYGLEHFGDKWSLLIIRDLMFKGKRHYNEFFESEENVSTSVLGDRLKMLENSGVISKGADSVKKSRIRYSLTEKGIAMLPLMVELIVWSGTYDESSEADADFIKEAQEHKEVFLEELRTHLIQDHLQA
jgi:DNA-binding HxlR family transcriptional regulator